MTYQILEAIKDALLAKTWASTTPKLVLVGPIPETLEYPVIGVLSSAGDADDDGLDNLESADEIEVTIAEAVMLGEESATMQRLLEMRDEIADMTFEENPWSVSAVQSTKYNGWVSSYAAFEDEMGDHSLWQYMTLKLTVDYTRAVL